jgi:hypothetical protein
MNALLSFIQGENVADNPDMDIFLSSISKFKSFEKILFANYIKDRQIEHLKKYYDKIVIVPDKEYPVVGYKVYYDWLCENGMHYEYVLHTDMRDVILQKDPFEFMKLNSDKSLFLCAEGMKISENDCNQMWHDWFLKTCFFNKGNYQDSEVINGGTYGGKLESVMLYMQMVWLGINRLSGYHEIIPDQAILGYMERQLRKNPKVMICHPMRDNFCCTGEAIKRDNVEIGFDGKNACDLENNPFYIFHQWDRTDLCNFYREKSLNALKFSL